MWPQLPKVTRFNIGRRSCIEVDLSFNPFGGVDLFQYVKMREHDTCSFISTLLFMVLLLLFPLVFFYLLRILFLNILVQQFFSSIYLTL